MKKKIFSLLLTLFILSAAPLLSQEKQDLWLRASTESNLEAKMNLLEQYAGEYGQDENAKVLYWNLSVISYQLKKYEKTVKYGEIALKQEGIDNKNRLNLYLYLANSYNVTKTDLDKAFHYADQVISLAKILKGEEEASPRYDRNYIAPALRIQIQILYAKGKNNPQTMLEAASKAVEIYDQYDKSRRSSQMILTLADRLYKLNKVDDAIKGVEKIVDLDRPNPKYINLLASWYSKKGDKDKAVSYLEKSYSARKNVKTAYNIGVLLQSKDVDKSIRYLAEAHMLNPENTQSKSYKLLRHLFYNVKARNKPKEEQDREFNDILAAAKARVAD